MPIVIVESPYAGDRERNYTYLRRIINVCLKDKEVPFAGHLYFPQFLDDKVEEERDWGIRMGYEFWPLAECVAFYTDYGMSSGMLLALDHWQFTVNSLDRDSRWPRIEFRSIGVNP